MSRSSDAWEMLREPAPTSVTIRGTPIGIGQRVLLKPRAGGDVMDLALADRTAVVAGIDVTTDGEPQFTVTIDDDPGRDLGAGRYPGHRFFFRADEIVVLEGPEDEPLADRARAPRILVAGIGNIFFGDDAFGVAVAQRLAGTVQPNVIVRDFGIRGMDLAYALHDGYDTAILVDAMARGGEPGTIYVIEPDLDDAANPEGIVPNAHGMDPVRVLQLARSLGAIPTHLVIVGCEPATIESGGSLGDELCSLSPAVDRAITEAVNAVGRLISSASAVTPSSQGGNQCR